MEGWQDRAVASVHESYRGQNLSREVVVNIRLKPPMLALLVRAVVKRHTNRAFYIRRTMSLLVAHDLGLPVRSVLELNPATRTGRKGLVGFDVLPDYGEGIESWCPHPGCDGSHF